MLKIDMRAREGKWNTNVKQMPNGSKPNSEKRLNHTEEEQLENNHPRVASDKMYFN